MKKILDSHKKKQDPLTMFSAVIRDADKSWLIYLDNTESLQVNVESEKGDLDTWASPGIDQWWRIATRGTTHGSPLTLIATTRYLLKDMDRALSIAKALELPFYIGNIMFLYAKLESSRSTPKAKGHGPRGRGIYVAGV